MAADRQHLHHRLLNIGHSYRQSVLIMYLWAALFSVTVVSLSLVRSPLVVFAVATVIAVLALLPVTMPGLRPWRALARRKAAITAAPHPGSPRPGTPGAGRYPKAGPPVAVPPAARPPAAARPPGPAINGSPASRYPASPVGGRLRAEDPFGEADRFPADGPVGGPDPFSPAPHPDARPRLGLRLGTDALTGPGLVRR
jgi:hypothetical protein